MIVLPAGLGVVAPAGGGGTSAFASEVLIDLPIGYWRLSETSGTAMADSSGSSRDGVYQVSPALGQPGLVLSEPFTSVEFLAASSARVERGLWMDVPNLTVMAIIRPSAVNAYQHIFDKANSGSRGWWIRITNTARIEFSYFSSGGRVTLVTTAAIAANTTYILHATYDGTTLAIYINGALSASMPSANAVAYSVDPITLGRNGGGTFPLTGRVQHAAYFATALSPTRIAAHAVAAGL